MVEGLAVGLTPRQGIREAVLGGVYGGAAVSVGWWAGVVRLRVPTPGLPSRAQVWAASRWTAKQQSQRAPLHPKPGMGQAGKGQSA